ncbi:GNAT family N-acetyltransferase [Paenibacillus beijingensis]|uniref:GNAT family acetyltransferase n=1 Tax=Paenibacillus beijingensis TaxID=1126833 RepID=A0A0D5NJ27_9BACL|nr:GNAT family N-acetyltransferase [Paenibacillus beijingensis]AJY75374.1 GNAT family acetyltransferase [Paenibacillus beijingensis]
MSSAPVVKEYFDAYQAQVVDLILHIQQQEYDIPITKEDQPDLFNIERFYQTGSGNFWVAIHDDKVVGTISLLDIGHHKVALRKMFVAKEYRGPELKTAYRLLQHAIAWAKEKSVKEIYLGTTAQFLAAHRFYEKNGFASIERSELPDRFPVVHVDTVFYKYVVD